MTIDTALPENISEIQMRQSDKLEALGRISYAIAHDVNNILAIIQGAAQLGQAKNRSTELEPYFSKILAAVSCGRGLTKELLNFAETKRAEKQNNIIDLAHLLTRKNSIAELILGGKFHIDVSLEVEPGPLYVNMDQAKLDQVLMNLCLNAADAMGSDGRIKIVAKKVVFDIEHMCQESTMMAGEYVFLGVEDSGCGMTEEIKRKIFDPFFTTKPHGKGSGLGLSSLYGIMKQCNGHFCVHSSVGEGTRFEIYFPSAKRNSESVPGA